MLAVALLLLFDLGVLVLNFATSYQISKDAHSINLAGRQRMLSQRAAKALLAVQTARAQNLPGTQDQAELRDACTYAQTHNLALPAQMNRLTTAVVHGIEAPATRQASGKAAAGAIYRNNRSI